MKRPANAISTILYLLFYLNVIFGCSAPDVKIPQPLPDSVKEYRHIKLYGNNPGMNNTGIFLKSEDTYSILATGSIDLHPGRPSKYHDVRPENGWPFMMRIGRTPYKIPFKNRNAETFSADYSGDLFLGVREGKVDSYGNPLRPDYYYDNGGFFEVHILVWAIDDYAQIADFFKQLKDRNPQKKSFNYSHARAVLKKELFLAAPTKPNDSILYQVSSLPAEVQAQFQRLQAFDYTLAIEVGKLPDFQGKVTDKQVLTLTRFTDIIQNATPEEKVNLANLLKVGKPEIRRYCTPLQAVFWFFEKDKYGAEKNPLQLSLKELLDKAWDFAEEQKWKNYEISTDRLNAPELVNYYQRKRMRYDLEFKIFQTYGEDRAPNPKYLFRNNEGTCRDFAAFSVYCLRKGGYKAKIHLVENPDKRPGTHKVCLFEGKDGREYIMDNGRSDKLRRFGIVPAQKYNPFTERLKLYPVNDNISQFY